MNRLYFGIAGGIAGAIITAMIIYTVAIPAQETQIRQEAFNPVLQKLCHDGYNMQANHLLNDTNVAYCKQLGYWN